MATVFVHVGQCGNQLGIPLWKHFLQCESEKHVFHSLDGYQRSIHIDSEPKVVKCIPKACKIREGNTIIGKRGRGTNFALGYYGMTSTGDDHILEHSLNAVRKEIERCDMYNGVVLFHSISGGTGSGFGAHLTECLRDDYPCALILSCAVAPCLSGESPLQSYNSLLNLHWLQTYSDAIVLLQNDLLIEKAQQCIYDEDEAKVKVSFMDINKVASKSISGLFLPTDTLSTSQGTKVGQEPWEMVRTLTPMPMTKFLSIGHHSSPKLSWTAMASKVCQQIPKYDNDSQLNKAIAATVVARGDSQSSFWSEARQGVEKKVRQGLSFVDWNPYPLDFWTAKETMSGKGINSSLSLAANSSCILDHISTVLERSCTKLNAGAYLHWYQRYGIEKDVLEESMETLEDIISQYRSATQ